MYGEDRPYKEVKYQVEKKYKESIWRASFGLQKVDNLTPSKYLIELSKKEIAGEITYEEIKQSLDEYYSSDKNKETEEADRVSLRMGEWLSQPRPFEISTKRLKLIHGFLFSGIDTFTYPVGKFRTVNISKEEPILNGKSVFYEAYNMLDLAFEHDLEEEIKKDYFSFSKEEKAKSAMKFISNIWQIHPFREGNTRTIAIFTIDYFRHLGFTLDNTIFEKHSKYFRNALVRDNCQTEYQTFQYLEYFIQNLLFDKNYDLEKMCLNIQQKSLEDEWEAEI